MNAPFQKPVRMTVNQFAAWAEEQPNDRYELLEGEVVAMAPENLGHVRTKLAVCNRLDAAIRDAGVSCEAFVDGLGLAVGDDTVLIPDVMVHCGGGLDETQSVIRDAVIVVEVLSPSTRAIDLTHKVGRYFRVPSVHHYLIFRTDNPAVLHHRRTTDGISVEIVQAGPLRLDPPGITLQLGTA